MGLSRASNNLPNLGGFFRNLVIQVLTGTTVQATADIVVMRNAAGLIFSGALNATLNMASSGVINGLDTGAAAINTWYNIFAVSNGSTIGIVASTGNSPAAGILTSYPFYARIGAVRNGAVSLWQTKQSGRRVQLQMGGVNLASLPVLASGSAGNVSTPTWVAIALASFVPPTASCLVFTLLGQSFTSGEIMFAPNANFGISGGATNAAPICLASLTVGYRATGMWSMFLESMNLYWASSWASAVVYLLGWEDNLD